MPIAASVRLGRNVMIHHPDLVNLYGCQVGDDTRVGAFVEIQKTATIGALCKISSHTFICEGVEIGDEVFVGHGVMFINDLYPRATAAGGLQTEADWKVVPTYVRKGASIGSGAVILGGIPIGDAAPAAPRAGARQEAPAPPAPPGAAPPARARGVGASHP